MPDATGTTPPDDNNPPATTAPNAATQIAIVEIPDDNGVGTGQYLLLQQYGNIVSIIVFDSNTNTAYSGTSSAATPLTVEATPDLLNLMATYGTSGSYDDLYFLDSSGAPVVLQMTADLPPEPGTDQVAQLLPTQRGKPWTPGQLNQWWTNPLDPYGTYPWLGGSSNPYYGSGRNGLPPDWATSQIISGNGDLTGLTWEQQQQIQKAVKRALGIYDQ